MCRLVSSWAETSTFRLLHTSFSNANWSRQRVAACFCWRCAGSFQAGLRLQHSAFLIQALATQSGVDDAWPHAFVGDKRGWLLASCCNFLIFPSGQTSSPANVPPFWCKLHVHKLESTTHAFVGNTRRRYFIALKNTKRWLSLVEERKLFRQRKASQIWIKQNNCRNQLFSASV